MPSSAKPESSEDGNKKSSAEKGAEENAPIEEEGAVGYQQPVFHLNYTSANPLPEPFLISRNNYNPDFLTDNDNNNVDENSNDHQYDEYAGYHQQYDQHIFVNQSQTLERRQATINAEYLGTVPPHNPRLPGNRNAVPDGVRLTRRDSVSSHRRNYSEDFSISPEELPPLTHSRTKNTDSGDRWYPRLSRRNIPSEEVVRQEARDLLCNFTAEEFRLQKINPPQSILETNYSDPAWVSAGKDLRLLADAFSRSRERSIVRKRAQKVNMHSITMENFFSMCSELFRGSEGISQERIVVLFTFISDVAIQHVMQGAERCLRQLMDWSFRFIWESVCCWVRQNGGWGAVMSRGANLVYHWTIFTLAALSVVALGIYIRKAFHT